MSDDVERYTTGRVEEGKTRYYEVRDFGRELWMHICQAGFAGREGKGREGKGSDAVFHACCIAEEDLMERRLRHGGRCIGDRKRKRSVEEKYGSYRLNSDVLL